MELFGVLALESTIALSSRSRREIALLFEGFSVLPQLRSTRSELKNAKSSEGNQQKRQPNSHL